MPVLSSFCEQSYLTAKTIATSAKSRKRKRRAIRAHPAVIGETRRGGSTAERQNRSRSVSRRSIRLTCGGLNRQRVHGSVHASGRDDVVNGFQEWSLTPVAPPRTLAGHIQAPSAATVPRRQTFRRSAISAGLLCLSTGYDRRGHAGMPASLAVRCPA